MKRLLYVSALLLVLTLLLPVAGHFGFWVAADDSPLGEVVSLRTQQTKTWYLGNGTYAVQSGLGPVHYQDNGWQDIDNSWVPSTVEPWQYEMTKDDYHAYAYSLFNWGQIMKFELGGNSVAFQPMDLQWTNALNQLQVISGPQSVSATVDNQPVEMLTDVYGTIGNLRWQNAYGVGRNFVWSANPGLLRPLLEINSTLPTPAAYIINGGNVSLRQSFIFAPTSSLGIYVNGLLWDKSSTVLTNQPIEFKSGSQVLWYFFPASCWSSALNQTPPSVTTRLRKAGSNLWLDILVPYEWLQTAVYPIYIDPDTGVKYATAVSTQSVLPEDDVNWTGATVANLNSDNNVYATCTLDYPFKSYRLKCQNFAFAIAGPVIIDGIYVEIRRKADVASQDRDYRVQLLDASGTLVGSNKKSATYYTTSEVTATYGNIIDTWTASPTEAMVEDVDFGICFSASCDGGDSATTSVEFVRMTVYYSTIVAPTLHTDPATNVLTTTATLNGEVTNTGYENPTVTVYWGDNDGGTTPASWDFNSAPTSPAQPQGVAAFYKDINSLSPSTLYYFTARGVNSGGTGWASTSNFTTESACSPSISLNTSSWSVNGGSPVAADSSYSTGIAYFRITNNSGGTVNITIGGTDMTGGNSWDLADDGSPGNMAYGMYAGLDDGDDLYDVIVRETATYNTLKSGLADAATQDFGLKLWTPTVYTDGVAKSGNITLTVTCD